MNYNTNEIKNKSKVHAGPMLNAYPDSLGGTLGDIVTFLKVPQTKDVFQSFYILPSVFNTDLDRGFSVIDYELNEVLADRKDIESLKDIGIDFKFDFILNHASVLSKQFQDIIQHGDNSPFKDFFINWNHFWEGHGEMTEEGYIQPHAHLIKDMFFRKPGLPILQVRFPDGSEVPYWNTFYQEVKYKTIDAQDLMQSIEIQYTAAEKLSELVNHSIQNGKKPKDIEFGVFSKYRDRVIDLLEANRKYLGQMDLNIKSPMVWDFYQETLQKLADYGAQIVRLDAFAYAPKEPGEKNLFNEPGTWEYLARVKSMAEELQLALLPEIHSTYGEKIHEKMAEHGYMTYDFFLPGLIIDAMERQTNEALLHWTNDILQKGMKTVNMLGCHDGIPLLDLRGLLSDEQIDNLIQTIVSRGGYVKNLHGNKQMYYQVNATYYSALGEDDRKLLLARAIQLFMPGKPQIWYLDVFAGKNNHAAMERAGSSGHKEINRTNLTLQDMESGLQTQIVKSQLSMIQFRNTCHAFGFEASLEIADTPGHIIHFKWSQNGQQAKLEANLRDYSFRIKATDENGNEIYQFIQE